MNELNHAEVKRAICEMHSKPLLKMGHLLDNVPDELDLLQEGIIDSLGVLELITQLEQRFQINVDLERLPAEQLTVLGPLSQHVAAFSTRAGAATGKIESSSSDL